MGERYTRHTVSWEQVRWENRILPDDAEGLPGLHTLEDLLAHSNWVELTLIKIGHSQVFPYVGEDVLINSPRGRVPPLVTGTYVFNAWPYLLLNFPRFGSADFSMLPSCTSCSQ